MSNRSKDIELAWVVDLKLSYSMAHQNGQQSLSSFQVVLNCRCCPYAVPLSKLTKSRRPLMMTNTYYKINSSADLGLTLRHFLVSHFQVSYSSKSLLVLTPHSLDTASTYPRAHTSSLNQPRSHLGPPLVSRRTLRAATISMISNA